MMPAPTEFAVKLAAELQRRPPFERVVQFFNPRAALQMKKARCDDVFLSYEAGQPNRYRNFAGNVQMPPESSQISRERVNMLMACRNITENDPFIDGILRKYEVYGVGDLRYEAETGDDKLNEEIEEQFDGWQERCDVTGRHDLETLTQLALREERASGDCGFVFVDDPGTGELRLQMVEGDCIGHPYQANIAPDYVNGVLINEAGAVTGYRVYQRNRLTAMYFNPIDVPVDYFLHYFDPSRVSFYRGVSAFHSVINTVLDLHETDEAMRLRIKYTSMIAALITTNTGGPSPQDITQMMTNASAPQAQPGNNQVNAFYAQLRYLGKGEDVKELQTDFPSESIQQFKDSMLRNIANCLNLSFDFLRDLSKLNGPAVRAVMAQDDREFARIRKNLVRRILNPVRNRVLFQMAASGDIACDPLDPRLYKGQWFFPGKLTIDLGKDTESNIRGYAAGILSLKDICTAAGEKWEDKQDQILAEAVRREQGRLDAPVELDRSDIRIVTTAGAEIRGEAQVEVADSPASGTQAP